MCECARTCFICAWASAGAGERLGDGPRVVGGLCLASSLTGVLLSDTTVRPDDIARVTVEAIPAFTALSDPTGQ